MVLKQDDGVWRVSIKTKSQRVSYALASTELEQAVLEAEQIYADVKSINQGIKYLAKTNSYDHIQALVVRDNKIIAKEDNRGTKKMMTKLKNNSGGILIKFPKKNKI